MEANGFPIENIPFGIFSTDTKTKRVGTAFGNNVVDLSELAALNCFSNTILSESNVFSCDSLNPFMELGKEAWLSARKSIQACIKSGKCESAFVPMSECQMHLPFTVGDYTDFYSSKEHATNIGTMWRGKENALMPNWLHIPVGYHGRASSVVVSGTDLHRPKGQIKPKDGDVSFGASKRIDFELEMAFVVGKGNTLGEPIDVNNASEHIFGVVLMNDWSARDIQAWEYVPLGPFLGKNFGTTISPWVITMTALEPFIVDAPEQIPTPLPYLREEKRSAYDINLTVEIKPEGSEDSSVVSSSNLKYLYWTFAQQLAHHTVNGCNMRTGDLCGTGTISGPTPESYGSMMELSWNGMNPVKLRNGSERSYIEDGDTVILKGQCIGKEYCISFGECSGKILPAK